MNAQINIFDEIIVDNFAGGGGASTGMELATGRPVAVAINHDPDAITMHKANHPYTRHLQASVWDVDPVEVCAGRPVGLAWFSPDCKHFSRAKGKALVDHNIRGLAWIVLRWAAKVRPRVIILENVPEFITWGPVRKGKPVKKLQGTTFRQWEKQLTELGYQIEYRELVAADYGAPTIRKRFYLVARCDGKPIVWPEKTHSRTGANNLPRWIPAAEIIDWSLPSYSIFATKKELKDRYGVNAVRPLAQNTQKRIIQGVDKYTIRSGKPYIVNCNHGGSGHVYSAEDPLTSQTVRASCGVVQPLLAPAIMCNNAQNQGAPMTDPLPTVTAGNRNYLAAAHLAQYHSEQGKDPRGQGLDRPICTVDGSNRYALVTAHIDKYFAGGYKCAGNGADEPVTTITAEPRHSLVTAHLNEYYGNAQELDIRDPLHTVTARDREALTLAHISEFKGADKGHAADQPLRTITASAGEFGAVKTVICRYVHGADLGYWPQVRALLNQHCGYHLAEDEILLLIIGGVAYFIRDILLRMLTPRELFRAMGFPDDYKIEVYRNGKSDGRGKQVARAGNAVCPAVAAALTRANVPEMCVTSQTLVTMAALLNTIAI